MLGSMIVDHFKPNFYSTDGKFVIAAIADTLLTKLIYGEWRSDEKSLELYQSRFQYYFNEYQQLSADIQLKSWFQAAMVPVGLSADSIDEAQLESRRCLEAMGVAPDRFLEGEILAALIFLGKEGVDKEAIPYFLQSEYQLAISKLPPTLELNIRSLLDCGNFEAYLKEACVYNDPSYLMMCGGLGQVFYNRLPAFLVDPMLDCLEEDIKAMILSFLKSFNCLPSW